MPYIVRWSCMHFLHITTSTDSEAVSEASSLSCYPIDTLNMSAMRCRHPLFRGPIGCSVNRRWPHLTFQTAVKLD